MHGWTLPFPIVSTNWCFYVSGGLERWQNYKQNQILLKLLKIHFPCTKQSHNLKSHNTSFLLGTIKHHNHHHTIFSHQAFPMFVVVLRVDESSAEVGGDTPVSGGGGGARWAGRLSKALMGGGGGGLWVGGWGGWQPCNAPIQPLEGSLNHNTSQRRRKKEEDSWFWLSLQVAENITRKKGIVFVVEYSPSDRELQLELIKGR